MPVEDKAEGSFTFDVFISFRGEDTRDRFTSHLHKELKNHGIKTFIDSEDLQKGKRIGELFKHMDGSKIFVPVFSKNYTDSKWCLEEIVKMVEIHNKEKEKRPIIPVFYDVEPKVVKHCTGSFGEAFHKHKEVDDMQINKWKAALTEAANFSGYSPSDANGNEAKLITLIGEHVFKQLCKVPFTFITQPIGIGHCIDALEQMLDKDGVCKIGIWGMGGIGKTTLAMVLYNKVFNKFEHSFFLKGIRENDQKKIHDLQAKFLNKVLGGTTIIDNIEAGVSLIKERLRNMKILLVLDDVDDSAQLEAFAADHQTNEKWLGTGSKIIVTTRDKGVLLNQGLQEDNIYLPKELNKEDALQLFCHHAFNKNKPLEGFEELSQKVVELAQRLPLALEEFGKLFKNTTEKQEWKEKLKKLKMDQPNKVYERLKISYDSLDDDGKNVFLDIACSFIGKIKKYPFYMWKACQYSPITTLNTLQHKSLITINEDKDGVFQMHDQIRNMGRKRVKEKGEGKYKYSRLWSKDQVLEVLRDPELGRCVQIIDFTEVSYEQIRISWNDAVAAMPKLRMITGAKQNHLCRDDKEIISLPSNLRWFGWKYCPCQTLTFHMERHDELRVLDLQCGDFRDFRSRTMEFPNLKVLDLNGCHNLIQTQNFTPQEFPNLKVLDVSYCKNLIQVPDFTHLPSLKVLKCDYCGPLAKMDVLINNLKKQVKLSTVGYDYERN